MKAAIILADVEFSLLAMGATTQVGDLDQTKQSV